MEAHFPLRRAIFVGLAGGSAEVLWISAYQWLADSSAALVARDVASTVVPQAGTHAMAPLLGLGIHLTLSVALGFAVVSALPSRRQLDFSGALSLLLGVLALIWAVNFLVLLPALDSPLATLLPAWVTLVSKLLFGAATAFALHLFGKDGRANWIAGRRPDTLRN